jgi:hypothetical protein
MSRLSTLRGIFQSAEDASSYVIFHHDLSPESVLRPQVLQVRGRCCKSLEFPISIIGWMDSEEICVNEPILAMLAEYAV